MNKRSILMIASLCSASAYAQKAYVSVAQNGVKVDAVGVAQYDVSQSLSIEFKDGKAVMSSADNKVAELPMTDGGQMVIAFDGEGSNTLTKTVKAGGYATFFSPFQVLVPEGEVEVYAPTYADGSLKLTESTLLPSGSIVPAGTGLLLKNTGEISFTFSADTPADIHSAFEGSALTIDKPSGNIYTLGHESTSGEYGFFRYAGTTMSAGKAWLSASDSNTPMVRFSFDEEIGNATGISTIGNRTTADGVRSENGRLVIVRNGKKYSTTGIAL